jgi:hypothetical protein
VVVENGSHSVPRQLRLPYPQICSHLPDKQIGGLKSRNVPIARLGYLWKTPSFELACNRLRFVVAEIANGWRFLQGCRPLRREPLPLFVVADPTADQEHSANRTFTKKRTYHSAHHHSPRIDVES